LMSCFLLQGETFRCNHQRHEILRIPQIPGKMYMLITV
jgi:hypothetical protein